MWNCWQFMWNICIRLETSCCWFMQLNLHCWVLAVSIVYCSLLFSSLASISQDSHIKMVVAGCKILDESWMEPVLLSSRKVLVLEDLRGPIFKSLSLSSNKSLSLSSSSEVKVLKSFRGLSRLSVSAHLCWGKCWGSYDVTSVWLVLWQLCISRKPRRLFETQCLQCCCHRGKSLSSRILEDQFSSWTSSPCPCPWSLIPCSRPWISSPWQQHWVELCEKVAK